MKWILPIAIGIVILVGSLFYIVTRRGYDPQLEHPDMDDAGMRHGTMLTPLGCLLYAPLTYDEKNDGYNVATYQHGKVISSVRASYSELQKQIVFEFRRDGTLAYWFKRDYLKSAIDTLTDSNGQKYTSHIIRPSSQLQLKRIFESGKWKANFKDSTLTIDFGDNNFGLISFEGKYTLLGAGKLALCQATDFDSLVNGKLERFMRKVNTYYESY